MSVKNFKFVSPGVFINEIDNSFIPRKPEAIGPVVIGRARRGISMEPVKVESYSDFVEMFGDTVPGFGGGDIYRDGNYSSPMYGTYAAKAFLNAGVAPLTYIRLLGHQDSNKESGLDAQAGWRTTKVLPANTASNGGAYGLWIWPSGSAANMGTASLGAIWYLDNGFVQLSGNYFLASDTVDNSTYNGDPAGNNTCMVFGNNSSTYEWTVCMSGAFMGTRTASFGFDDTSSNFIRNKFTTNPQLISGAFYPTTALQDYWLGETFEHDLRYQNKVSTALLGAILPLYQTTATVTPANMKGQASTEAKAGWFIGQDLGSPSSYVPFNKQKLFRLVGRGHGAWLQKNVKVSISNIRQSTTTTTDYGTFSVVLRSFTDTDNAVQVLERFDNCNLDPTSPNFVARKIGDKYSSWNDSERRLKTYGEYDNNSKFVYVDMDSDVEAGGANPTLLPVGFFGPPRFTGITDLSGNGGDGAGRILQNGQVVDNLILTGSSNGARDAVDGNAGAGGIFFPDVGASAGFRRNCEPFFSSALPAKGGTFSKIQNSLLTGSLMFPSGTMRISAAAGDLSDPRDAYFGFDTRRTATGTTSDKGASDMLRAWTNDWPADPTTETTTYIDGYSYVFSLDDIATANSSYFYQSGSRVLGTAVSDTTITTLLDAGYDKFTAPFCGGSDGFDIMKPDPLYNAGMAGTPTNINSYEYYTFKRAIDTVADPEFTNMNLLAVPGLTQTGLTEHMINVCEERADSLALIDLPDVYIPPAEARQTSKDQRIGTTPIQAATSLRDRRIDSSYGCTFYPWVQTRDENTGALLWIPPSVAMMGVLASSERKSQIWFAPAGFNRGGLSKGAAGLPITGITQRLTSKERDTLYESNINPIASFPSNGIVVFGQKTLQERQSALDRINVRRLVIYLKKQISILSTQILFEQNVQATWNRFIALVEPFLANVKTSFGITDYRLILDDSTTTPDLIDQNILYAKIMIKPARAIEYIAIDFVIMSTGASFED